MIEPYFETERGKLYCGDCLEIVKKISSFSIDLIITDPPYNFTTASAGSGKLNPWADICNSSYWFSSWMKTAFKLLKPNGALWGFCNWRSLPIITKAAFDTGRQIESLLIWDKCCFGTGGTKGLRPSYEMVYLICNDKFQIKDRRLADIQKFHWPSYRPSGHPAEKPIKLINWLLEICNPKTVIDFFIGSGTTILACELKKIEWLGIEISEEWCAVAKKRILRETRQLNL